MHELTSTGAGKGSAPRHKCDANWKQNFDAIQWDKASAEKGFVKRRGKITKRYK